MDEYFQIFDRVLSVVGVTIYSKTKWDSSLWLALQTFNFIIGLLVFIFTTVFVFVSSSDIVIWIEGACIWTTAVIMIISLGVCLVFRKDFRIFLNEMAFQDGVLEMPLISYVLKLECSGKLNELKVMVVDSQEKLLKYTRMLLIIYVASVWLCATLYICDPIYQMIVGEDESLRLLGKYLVSEKNFLFYSIFY